MKNKIVRIIIVTFFLIIALVICNIAPQYDLVYKYKDGDIRVILDDKEITRDINKMPESAMMVEGEIMLSSNTIDILFDKNLYYEDKYDTYITTSKNHRANLKVGDKNIKIDNKVENVRIPPMRVKYDYSSDNRYSNSEEYKNKNKEVVYFPIKELEVVYDIDVEFNEKVIITKNNKKRMRIKLKGDEKIELKHFADQFSKNVEIIGNENYIDFYNYDSNKKFVFARSQNGELGYIDNSKIAKYEKEVITEEKKYVEPKKVNLAWDYINPNAINIESKLEREKIFPIDVVAPTLLYLKNIKGEINYNKEIAEKYINWAKSEKYEVWATFKNDDFKISETSDFLNDMKSRNEAIKEIIDFAKKYNIEGINVDLEHIYQEDATALSQFVRELCVEAHGYNLLISVCVNVPDGSPDWSLCYQHKILSEYADYLAIMMYDQYGVNSKLPGPNATLKWVNENLEKLINRDKIKSDRIILGIPLYSRLWTRNGAKWKSSTLTISGNKKYLNKPEVEWNSEIGQYYYENEDKTVCLWIEENKSIAEKVKLVEKYKLAGTAFWMLGYETDDIWDVLKK